MNRLKLHIVLLFLAALGTGVVVGMGVSRNTIAPKPADRGSWLAEQLTLTPEQSEKMKTIWSDMLHAPGQSTRERHDQYREDRDKAVAALLTESQKSAYDDIQKKYRQQVDLLDEERKQVFQAAVEKTKAILTDTQRAKYEEILKDGPPGRQGRGGRGPSTHRAISTTQAAPAANSM